MKIYKFMEPINIISTPDITGNIGSCTSQSITVESGRTFFILNKSTVVTNSCTGQIEEFKTWEFAPSMQMIGAIFFLFLIFLFLIWLRYQYLPSFLTEKEFKIYKERGSRFLK